MSEEVDRLMEDLGLKKETVEIPDFEKLEKAEMYDNIKKIADALESNQRILLDLLQNILKGQEAIRQAIGQLALTRVKEKGEKKEVWRHTPTTIQIPQIDFGHTYYRTAMPQRASWKTFAWQRSGRKARSL